MDTYTHTLTVTDATGYIEAGAATWRVHRSGGSNCDQVDLRYVNRTAFHPLRDCTIFDLDVSASTIPGWCCPKSCFRVSPYVPEV